MEKTETTRSPLHWKRKTAMAIGRPELANSGDELLEAACDDHALAVQRLMAEGDDEGKTVAVPPREMDPGARAKTSMPPGPASVVNVAPPLLNEGQKRAKFQGLVNEACHRQGIDRGEAIQQVQTLHPELYPSAEAPKGRSKEQVRQEEDRRREIMHLVNEMMQAGGGDYDLCYRVVRSDRPDLFAGMTEPARGK
jgi:hypothetical protein